MTAPTGLRRLPLSLLTIGSLLLAATSGALAPGCSDDDASRTTSAWSLPSFVMELETFSEGRRDGTIVLTYESGLLTITVSPYGVVDIGAADPGVRTVPPAPDWFISPDTARARGASR